MRRLRGLRESLVAAYEAGPLAMAAYEVSVDVCLAGRDWPELRKALAVLCSSLYPQRAQQQVQQGGSGACGRGGGGEGVGPEAAKGPDAGRGQEGASVSQPPPPSSPDVGPSSSEDRVAEMYALQLLLLAAPELDRRGGGGPGSAAGGGRAGDGAGGGCELVAALREAQLAAQWGQPAVAFALQVRRRRTDVGWRACEVRLWTVL